MNVSSDQQRFHQWRLVLVAISLLVGLPLVCAQTQGPSFELQVLPILSENCFHCHGPDERQRKAGLRLDSLTAASSLLKSGARAIVPGDSSSSELIARIHSADPDEVMPPDDSGKALSAAQVSVLERWIQHGASYSVHWAYRPLQDSAVPTLASGLEALNAIDGFVFSRLEREGVKPAPSVDRYGLIKRLHYDLLGLLPSPEDVQSFVEDGQPNAYERLVTRLLESEHFGERWGRHWLDKARYADSDGYEKDNPRPHAWKYRDWVIRAFNDDMPFDQFTIEQLAGDLLPEATENQYLATAFHRQTLTNTEGGTNREQWRVAAVMDRTETTGSVWLGLTVGCARCHTHKYDAISHHEYYQLYAYFNNGDETTKPMAKSHSALVHYEQQKPKYDRQWSGLDLQIKARIASLESSRTQWEAQLRQALLAGKVEGISDSLKEAVLKTEAARDEKEIKTVRDYFHQQDEALVSLRRSAEELKKTEPKSPYLNIRIVTQRTEESRTTHVLERGEFSKPLDEVIPGVLSVLPDIEPRVPESVGDRLDFARWLVSEENPLTPRVIVNQIWANLFGEGLVATRNDFGVRGELPSHPALLDHLARTFIDRGWSRKELIRYIVMSATYRQSSHHRPELLDRDPKNRWLARQNRFRVEAEIVRDIYLDAGGLLSKTLGGPSVFPPTSKDVVALTYNSSVKWNVSPGEDKYRRGIYTFFKRTAPHPNLMTFDCPDSNTTCVERNRSNTPLAALATLNNEVFVEAAKGFSHRVLSWEKANDRERMQAAFLAATIRKAGPEELDALMDLLSVSLAYYRKHPEEAQRFLGGVSQEGRNPVDVAAWAATLRIVLNLDEVITRS